MYLLKIHSFEYLLSIYYVPGLLACEYINEQDRQGPWPCWTYSPVEERENWTGKVWFISWEHRGEVLIDLRSFLQGRGI